MRFTRSARHLAAVALVMVGLAACSSSPDSDDAAANTGTGAAAPVTVRLPTLPETKWTTAGDLCAIVSGELAQQMLTHASPLVASFRPDMMPANGAGFDACTYIDETAPGWSAQVMVLKATAADTPEANRKNITDRKGTVEEFNVPGVDAAFYGGGQAFVFMNGVMATTNNNSGGKFNSASLIRLTALAAIITRS